MERFIGSRICYRLSIRCDLKSSMERFIAAMLSLLSYKLTHLKSSMERFIVKETLVDILESKFKIQYGEIYRVYRLGQG